MYRWGNWPLREGKTPLKLASEPELEYRDLEDRDPSLSIHHTFSLRLTQEENTTSAKIIVPGLGRKGLFFPSSSSCPLHNIQHNAPGRPVGVGDRPLGERDGVLPVSSWPGRGNQSLPEDGLRLVEFEAF